MCCTCVPATASPAGRDNRDEASPMGVGDTIATDDDDEEESGTDTGIPKDRGRGRARGSEADDDDGAATETLPSATALFAATPAELASPRMPPVGYLLSCAVTLPFASTTRPLPTLTPLAVWRP